MTTRKSKARKTNRFLLSEMPDFIPASKVYSDFGIPRNLLRELAERGVVRRRESTFDGGANVLFTYSRSDLKRYVDGASEVSHG